MLTSYVNEVHVNFTPKFMLEKLNKVEAVTDVVDFLREMWPDDIQFRERFYVLYLNRQNRILGYYCLSVGSLSATVVDIKMIFQPVLRLHASGIILAHNHPSGNLQPSDQDKDLTRKIERVCKDMDVSLLDHVILTYSGYYSFNSCGLI